jgi:hypothetical protein
VSPEDRQLLEALATDSDVVEFLAATAAEDQQLLAELLEAAEP